MLKINLLPAYIREKRVIRRMAMGFGILIVVIIAGILVASLILSSRIARQDTAVADMEQRKAVVDQIQTMTAAEQGKLSTIQSKISFIEGLMAYNLRVPALLDELARYTYGRIVYKSVQITSDTLTIQAHAKNVGDCGRYLLNMYRASHKFSSVAIDKIPGWSEGGGTSSEASPSSPPMPGGPMPGGPPLIPGALVMAGPPVSIESGRSSEGPSSGFDFTVTCKLREPIVAPVYAMQSAGAAGAAGAPGAAGAGAAPPAGGSPSAGQGAESEPSEEPGIKRPNPLGGAGAEE